MEGKRTHPCGVTGSVVGAVVGLIGLIGLIVLGVLVLIGMVVLSLVRNQKVLTDKAAKVATEPEEIRALIQSSAAAHTFPFTALCRKQSAKTVFPEPPPAPARAGGAARAAGNACPGWMRRDAVFCSDVCRARHRWWSLRTGSRSR